MDIFWALYIGDHSKAQLCLNNHRRDRGFGEGLAITRTSQGELKYGTRLDEGLNVTREEYKKHFIDVEKSMAKAEEEQIVNDGADVSRVSLSAKKRRTRD